MDSLKKTGVVCLSVDEFNETTQFRHVAGVHEFFHVTTVNSLDLIDNLSNIIYMSSAKELSEFLEIAEAVNEKGVGQKWQ